ncbi:PhnD/SsuA/transferrin family substrate-binding protein [Streptomyces marincola]|uniref:PhnD/SsuA/transferrin family substrate-binding protein n=1 Tax=Streptomyces marincola TaxID=2878388 RepID=UPI00131E9AE3|nr:PhnD/SsuA/transferrin family substrate-binding protein [Streptomyces marincola]
MPSTTRVPRLAALAALVPRDSDVQELSDLAGQEFCFVDENSTSGSSTPRRP